MRGGLGVWLNLRPPPGEPERKQQARLQEGAPAPQVADDTGCGPREDRGEEEGANSPGDRVALQGPGVFQNVF